MAQRRSASPCSLRRARSDGSLGRAWSLIAPKFASQLLFCAFEHAPLARAEVVTGAIDVESQHRHGRAVRVALSPMTLLGRMLEGRRDPVWVGPREDASIQIESVAVLRHVGRPAVRGALRVGVRSFRITIAFWHLRPSRPVESIGCHRPRDRVVRRAPDRRSDEAIARLVSRGESRFSARRAA